MSSKHAYLMMIHNEFYILEKLIMLLDSEYNDLYIHVDKKVKNFDFEYFKKIPKKSSIFFINPRIKIYWGDFSQIKCETMLLAEAFKKKYSYYHLISGTDLPIKTSKYIYDFYESNKYEFVSYNDFYCKDRVKFYYFRFTKKDKFHYIINKIFVEIQDVLKINRIKDTNIEFKNGMAWYSISNNLAKYILDNKEFLEKYFKHTICGDEMYIQTLVWNSKFKERVYNINLFDSRSVCRLIDWNRGKPYEFDIDDYKLLTESKCLFARKFSTKTEKQKKLVDEIYNFVKESEKMENNRRECA